MLHSPASFAEQNPQPQNNQSVMLLISLLLKFSVDKCEQSGSNVIKAQSSQFLAFVTMINQSSYSQTSNCHNLERRMEGFDFLHPAVPL